MAKNSTGRTRLEGNAAATAGVAMNEVRASHGGLNPRGEGTVAESGFGTEVAPMVAGTAAAPLINEFVANHTGADTSEFVEIRAAAGADLAGLTLIEIEGDGSGAGSIDGVWSLGTANADGYWTTGFLNNEIENGTVTLLLVEGFTGSEGDDLDTDDDGIFDATPWSAVLDGVAVADGGESDRAYAETVLDPAFGDGFTVGGASRIPDGADTDGAADWVSNDFDLAGIQPGTPEPGEGLNTPGAENDAVGEDAEPLSLVINEFLADPAADVASGDANGDGTRDATEDEFVEIVNTGTELADLGGVAMSDAFGVRHVFAGGTALAPGEAIIIFGGGTPIGSFGGAQVVTASSGALGLNNTGDTLTLLAAGGTTVLDEVSYGGEGGNDVSLTRSPELTGDFAAHTSVASTPFSPGTEADGTPFADGGDDTTLISAIQGSGRTSARVGQTVTLEAIVVGDYVDGLGGGASGLGGFYLQEEDGDADEDATTSEGIFVFAPGAGIAVGDRVRVTGTVEEFGGQTQIGAVTGLEVVTSGNDLPTAAEITFPVASIVEIDGRLVADLEMYEGMRVTFPQELTVGDVFDLGRFGETDLNALGRVPTYTQVNEPSAEGFQDYIETTVRNAIVLDDGQGSQNPSVLPFEIEGESGNIEGEFDAGDDLNSGDTITGLTGVLGEGFDQYRVQPTEVVEFTNANPREPEAPDVGGTLRVATFNVLNYFTTLGEEGLTSGPGAGQEPRGADDLAEFERQTDKLIAALSEIEADVLGLIEIENEFGDQNGDASSPSRPSLPNSTRRPACNTPSSIRACPTSATTPSPSD